MKRRTPEAHPFIAPLNFELVVSNNKTSIATMEHRHDQQKNFVFPLL